MGHLFKLFCSRIINLLLIDECLLNQYIYIKKYIYKLYIRTKTRRRNGFKSNHYVKAYIEITCIINRRKKSLLKQCKLWKIQSHRENRREKKGVCKVAPPRLRNKKQSSFVENWTVEITQRKKERKKPTTL